MIQHALIDLRDLQYFWHVFINDNTFWTLFINNQTQKLYWGTLQWTDNWYTDIPTNRLTCLEMVYWVVFSDWLPDRLNDKQVARKYVLYFAIEHPKTNFEIKYLNDFNICPQYLIQNYWKTNTRKRVDRGGNAYFCIFSTRQLPKKQSLASSSQYQILKSSMNQRKSEIQFS